ncbi:InlB B-repeat-containing protein [Schumannella luteola]|nr:InlB B-repeat-containing protein [Schumannella luteola]
MATHDVVGSVDDGTVLETVNNGADAEYGHETGGASGSGNPGANGASTSATPYGSGGGAGSGTTNHADGGAGATVSNIAPSGSLFTGDTRCFGGGGAVGVVGFTDVTDAHGVPGCGGGGPADAAATTLTIPTANSGGGGGGLTIPQPDEQRAGAAGVIIFRWTAAPITVSFDAQGHGTAPASQTLVAGTAPTAPAAPTADGYDFGGWYLDAALTTPADFSVAVSASTTFYAKWVPALAATGAELSPALVGTAVLALFAGAGALAVARRRRESD